MTHSLQIAGTRGWMSTDFKPTRLASAAQGREQIVRIVDRVRGTARADLPAALAREIGRIIAWGADSNLFHRGPAKESDNSDVIAATWRSRASFSGAPSDPTDLSASMQNYPWIWAADRRKPPASRYAASRRSLLPAPSIRRRSGRLLSPTNGSRGAASLNGRGKGLPGKRSANVGSRPSKRRKRH